MAAATAATAAMAARPAAPAGTDPGSVFPFAVHPVTLDNGLQILVIPYDSPGIMAFYTVVRTGSRDEVEPGRSGYAHFFEHMMFRGTDKYPIERYNEELKEIGADFNASTSSDVTIYTVIAPSSALEKVMDLESDRFQHLKYSEPDFRTEALAVLGEYNKNSSDPLRRLDEKTKDLAYEKHTYKHTTMGFLQDIKAMPEGYEYSRQFFNRFYRPENATLVVVGDVEPQKVQALARRYYGGWQRGYQAPAVTPEPPQQGPKTGHVEWPNPTRPYALIAYHVPGFSTKTVDSAALDILSELLFSESAPLYQDLVVDKQWADILDSDSGGQRDASLFEVEVRAKSEDLLPKVKEAIDREIGRLQQGEIDAERLARIKSSLRNSFILSLDTPESVARQAAQIVSLSGDVNDINRLYAQYQKVTPADVQRLAREVFRRDNETFVTLSHTAQARPTSQPGGAHD